MLQSGNNGGYIESTSNKHLLPSWKHWYACGSTFKITKGT